MTHDVDQCVDTDSLAALRSRFPGWQVWRGVSGLLYARRLRTSPPVVVRAVTPDDLAAKITKYEGGKR
ncbi:MAG TPA: hypothetical protein VEC76_08570 [Streptosporangiaceae bacterium]|nr:hypothetical protein [Streptosporangiaceae bacterium]